MAAEPIEVEDDEAERNSCILIARPPTCGEYLGTMSAIEFVATEQRRTVHRLFGTTGLGRPVIRLSEDLGHPSELRSSTLVPPLRYSMTFPAMLGSEQVV